MDKIDRNALEAALARARLQRRLPCPELRRYLREGAGISQTDLARVLSVDRASVSRWESGTRRPGPGLLGKYLDVLDQLARARGTEAAP